MTRLQPVAGQVAVELRWRPAGQSLLTPDAALTSNAAIVTAHAPRALAGMAAVPSAKAELLTRCLQTSDFVGVGAQAAIRGVVFHGFAHVYACSSDLQLSKFLHPCHNGSCSVWE